jgi:hypothetical protein
MVFFALILFVNNYSNLAKNVMETKKNGKVKTGPQ